jgi:hypothetical protein
MPDRKTLSGLLAATLVVAATAAPAAQAVPVDAQKPASAQQDLRTEASAGQSGSALSPQTKTPAAQLDMYASTVEKPSPAKQDLRSEAAADPARAPEPPLGLPTWPADPKPIAPVTTQPVADGDGGGVDWQVPVLAIVGSLLLLGGAAVLGTRYRTAA